ncbi:MAG: hypothetical protein ACC642_11650, partial [Pseudomonadales bacterium]
ERVRMHVCWGNYDGPHDIEHPEVVADRLERVAVAMGDPTRIVAGTDCGFDTAAGFRDVADDVVWAKLKALSDGAEIATERLY